MLKFTLKSVSGSCQILGPLPTEHRDAITFMVVHDEETSGEDDITTAPDDATTRTAVNTDGAVASDAAVDTDDATSDAAVDTNEAVPNDAADDTDDAVPDDAAANVEESEGGLLEVQRRDTQIDQLRYQQRTLKLRDDLKAALSAQAAKQNLIDKATQLKTEALIRHKRFEGDAAMIESSANEKDRRLYSGEIHSIKGLETLQSEIRHMRARQEHLEEKAIESLIEADEQDEIVATLIDERASTDERITVLEAELAAALEKLDKKIAVASAARDRAAAAVDEHTLVMYERLRPTFGHSTAVSFDPITGCGCPNLMPAAEVVRIKQHEPGTVLECAECSRLVMC